MRVCLPAATGTASLGCWWGDEGYERVKFVHTPQGAIFPLGHPAMAPLQAWGDSLPHLCSPHSPWEPLRTPLYSLPRLALSSACPGSTRTQVGLPPGREGLILFVFLKSVLWFHSPLCQPWKLEVGGPGCALGLPSPPPIPCSA